MNISKILHNIACFFLGDPEVFNMPKDFYFREDSRSLPMPKDDNYAQQKERYIVNIFRAKLYDYTILHFARCASLLFAMIAILSFIYIYVGGSYNAELQQF